MVPTEDHAARIHFMAVLQLPHVPQIQGAARMVVSVDPMVRVLRGEVSTARSVDTTKAELRGDTPHAVTPAWEDLTVAEALVAEGSTEAVAASTAVAGIDNVISAGDHALW